MPEGYRITRRCTCEWREALHMVDGFVPYITAHDPRCPKHGAAARDADFRAVVRGDVEPEVFVRRWGDLSAPPPPKRRKRLQDPVTRYLTGQIDTAGFLLEYDRPDVAPVAPPFQPRHVWDDRIKEWRPVRDMTDAALMA